MADPVKTLGFVDRVAEGTVVVTAAYTVDKTDTLVLVATAGGAYAVTLPAASTFRPGQEITFKKTDSSANDCTVTRAGSDTIDGATTKVLGAQYDFLRLASDGGTKWHVVGSVLSA